MYLEISFGNNTVVEPEKYGNSTIVMPSNLLYFLFKSKFELKEEKWKLQK